jgi:hypothetical protein
MKLAEFEAGLTARLRGLGFACAEADREGPMGSGLVRYSSGRSDVVLTSDRGVLGITIGLPGGASFGYQSWAELLDLEVDADLGVDAQADFLLGHVGQIENMIEQDPAVGERLRSANWRFVKEFLGLDPDMQKPDASEGF